MENVIEARFVLGVLCFIHLLVGYASSAVHDVINKKVLNGLFVLELVAVTAYVIYDNLQAPPLCTPFWATVGYIFVYGFITLTWICYLPYTRLEKDKVYEMTIAYKVRFLNNDYLEGTIVNGKNEVSVLLPYDEKFPASEVPRKVKVKFKIFMQGYCIVSAI